MIFDKNIEKYMSIESLNNVFQNALTKKHILFCRLKPKLSNEIPGENIHLKAI